MNKHKIITVFTFMLFLATSQAQAQTDAGSKTVENSKVNILARTYDPTRPEHTFVPLKGRSLLITNQNRYQKVKRH